MSLGEKLKNMFAKEATKEQVTRFLETEQGQDLLVEIVQKEMPTWFNEKQKPVSQETTPIIKDVETIRTVDKEN